MTQILKFTLPKAELTRAINTLNLCRLTRTKQRRVLRNVDRTIRKEARLNIRRQETISGPAFARRKNKKRKKMLTKLARHLSGKIHTDRLTIGYNNRQIGIIAYRQQYGAPEQYTPRKVKRLRKKTEGSYSSPATRQQAKALRKMGYTVPKKRGSGDKTPSVNWIVDNMNKGKAGLLIRQLSNKRTRSSWEISPEPRPFLGMTEAQSQRLLTDEILQVMNR